VQFATFPDALVPYYRTSHVAAPHRTCRPTAAAARSIGDRAFRGDPCLGDAVLAQADHSPRPRTAPSVRRHGVGTDHVLPVTTRGRRGFAVAKTPHPAGPLTKELAADVGGSINFRYRPNGSRSPGSSMVPAAIPTRGVGADGRTASVATPSKLRRPVARHRVSLPAIPRHLAVCSTAKMIPTQERGDLESIVLVEVSKLDDTQIPRNDPMAPMLFLACLRPAPRWRDQRRDPRLSTRRRGARNGVGQCPSLRKRS
jgi:hypothetical protein